MAASESLAEEYAQGSYLPADAVVCGSTLPVDRYPSTVRFVAFTLFTDGVTPNFAQMRYLTLQRHIASGRGKNDVDEFTKVVVAPLVERIERSMPTATLPAPDAPIAKIRQAVVELARIESLSRSTGRRLDPQLPSDELRAAYSAWRRDSEAHHIASSLSFLSLLGAATNSFDVHAIGDHLRGRFFPGPYLPGSTPEYQIGLCSEYEQEWSLLGYTRGELINSIGLAPGEQLTLELHTWDKMTTKTEDELAAESELRTTHKYTERDALNVAKEYAKTKSTSLNAGGTVPIPNMPVSVSANVSTEVRSSLSETSEKLSEETTETSESLKVNKKSRVEVARDQGREDRQLRVIENSNNCHTLNCHYYELMANYSVATRLVSVTPCLLIDNRRPMITLDWIICNAHVLREALLHQAFLDGFDAAVSLKRLQTEERLRQIWVASQIQDSESALRPQVDVILNAYDVLIDAARLFSLAAANCITSDSLYDLIIDGLECLESGGVTQEIVKRAVFGVQLLAPLRQALDSLRLASLSGNDLLGPLRTIVDLILDPAEWAASSSGADSAYYETLIMENLGQVTQALNLRTAGIAHVFAERPWDDAGLGNALVAARSTVLDLVQRISPEASAGPPNFTDTADAQVRYERLRCHLEANWVHYGQAVWASENHAQRLERLAEDSISSLIENEILGFYGSRSAFPLRTVDNLQSAIDLSDVVEEARKALSDTQPNPALIALPTAGSLLEAMVGACDACEDDILERHRIERMRLEAQALQAKAEADRRATRVTLGDLDDPLRTVPVLNINLSRDESP